MFKELLSLVLVALVLNSFGVRPAKAESLQDKEAKQVEKIRENIRKLGTGPEAKVEVKLKSNRKLKGFIKEAEETSFVVVEGKTGAVSTVAYSEVKEVKGSNRLTAAKIGITIVKGVLVVAAVAAIATVLMALMIPRT